MNKRWHTIIYLAVFAGVVAVLSLGGLVRADRGSSALEQRRLAQFPSLRWTDLRSGAFGRELEAYLSDQFLGRDRWVSSYTKLDLKVLGKVAMNGVVVGKGGVLLGDLTDHKPLTDAQMATELDATMSQFAGLDRSVRSYGGRLLVVGHPTKNSFLRADYPSGFGFPEDLARVEPRYFAGLDRLGIANVRMAPIFEAHRSEKLYYLTDHHWTFRGAYLTYAAMMERLGLKPLAMSDLDAVTLPNRFTGSFNRKIAMAFPQDEKVTIATPKVPIPYTRTQDGKVSHDLFRAHPASAAVAYGIYDQGDHAEVVIDTDRPSLPTLLLVGDSFTNAIETLVWTGFDQSRYLDLRHYTKTSLEEYVAVHRPDVVVVLVRDERYLYRSGNGAFSSASAGSETDE